MPTYPVALGYSILSAPILYPPYHEKQTLFPLSLALNWRSHIALDKYTDRGSEASSAPTIALNCCGVSVHPPASETQLTTQPADPLPRNLKLRCPAEPSLR